MIVQLRKVKSSFCEMPKSVRRHSKWTIYITSHNGRLNNHWLIKVIIVLSRKHDGWVANLAALFPEIVIHLFFKWEKGIMWWARCPLLQLHTHLPRFQGIPIFQVWTDSNWNQKCILGQSYIVTKHAKKRKVHLSIFLLSHLSYNVNFPTLR